MQLLDDLRHEHDRIDAVLGSLRTWAERLVHGTAPLSDRDGFVHFFTVYAGAFHHEREEDLLIPALVQDALLSTEHGPIAVLLEDHRSMAALMRAIAATDDPATLCDLATRYSHALWMHIDVENSVFFPESETQLRRNGMLELSARPANDEELVAAAVGDVLRDLYPPMQPDVPRGDGCVMCHAYGDTCRGLEREWWNEWTWDELSEHVAAS